MTMKDLADSGGFLELEKRVSELEKEIAELKKK
jgi:hypothetical protein